MENIGPWIFASVALASAVFVLSRFPKARRYTLYIAVSFIILCVGLLAIIWINQTIEDRKRKVAKTLIDPSFVAVSDSTLRIDGALSELRGTLTNKSMFPIERVEFTIAVVICQDKTPCPNDKVAVTADGATYINIPSGGTKPIQAYVDIGGFTLPRDKNWEWSFLKLTPIAPISAVD